MISNSFCKWGSPNLPSVNYMASEGVQNKPLLASEWEWQSHGDWLWNWQRSTSLKVSRVVTGCPGKGNSDKLWQCEEAEVPFVAEHLQSRTALPQSCTEARSSQLGLGKEQILLHFHNGCWFLKAWHSSALRFLLISHGKYCVETLWTKTPNMPQVWSVPEDLPWTKGFCFRHHSGKKGRRKSHQCRCACWLTNHNCMQILEGPEQWWFHPVPDQLSGIESPENYVHW